MPNQSDGKNLLNEWLIGTKDNPGLVTQRKLSIENFARELGLTRAAIYYYLKDINRPSPETLRSMCNFFGVSYEEGLKWVDPRPKHRIPSDSKRQRRIRNRAA